MPEATPNTKYFSSNVKGKIILMFYVMRYELIIFITCQLLDETVVKMIKQDKRFEKITYGKNKKSSHRSY